MKMIFSDDKKTFGIFFTEGEFLLASKLLGHVKLSDDESVKKTVDIMMKLEALQYKVPVLKLIHANPHCKFCGDSLKSKGHLELGTHKWFCCIRRCKEVQDGKT